MITNRTQLTENTRAGHFGHVDQSEWTRRSNQITDQIYQLLLAGASFLEINDFARKERFQLANSLHPDDADEFGLIRRARGSDSYELGWFNDVVMDKAVFLTIQQILSEQKAIFTKKEIDVIELNLGYRRAWGNIRYYYYENTNLSDLMNITFYSEFDIKTDKEIILRVETQYPLMNGFIYMETMRQFSACLDYLKKTKERSNAAAFLLGLVLYDLSRIVPQKRGTAAINGWIIRALGRLKKFDIQLLRIRGIPFDIYGQVQFDRIKFAIEIAQSIKEDFKFDHECHAYTDFFPEIIEEAKHREKIILMIYNAVEIIGRYLGHKLSTNNKHLFMPHRANALLLRSNLEKLIYADKLSNIELVESILNVIQNSDVGRNLKYGLHKVLNDLDGAKQRPGHSFCS